MSKEINKEELYKIVEEQTKKGKRATDIGLYLKKKYKIDSVKKQFGLKVTDIQKELKLKENKLPDDLLDLIKRSVALLKHLEENKKDTSAKRGYQITVSKINRLRKYYIENNVIPKTWRYSKETAKLLIK